MSAHQTLLLTLREIRLIFERLVQAAGTPHGMLPAARDAAVAAALATPDGLARMPDWIAALRGSACRPVDVSEVTGGLTVDCRGQHAFHCAETLLDIMVDAARTCGTGMATARNVTCADALAGIRVLAEKHGFAVDVSHVGDTVHLALLPRRSADITTLDLLRLEGRAVPAALWWQLYDGSLEALAPDSFESRRHAGTVRVEADGRLVGRNDEDETDLSMLTADTSAIRTPTGTPLQG